MYRRILAVSLVVAFVASPIAAQTPLPIVEDVAWQSLREHCLQLLRAQAPLPPETVRAVQALLDKKPDDAEAAARAVQKLLDPHCLLAVNINPESRVKAARGPAGVELHQNQPRIVLIKVHNEGGVTHRLRVQGPGILRGEEADEGRWLRAVLVAEAPFGTELSGRRLEYRLLRLTPRQAGKREATFQFDVGQGTQDLGFRAEVPILFSIRAATRK